MPTERDLVADVVVSDDRAMLILHGELDLMQREALSTALDEARGAAKHLHVDLTDVQFLDWIALSLIVRAAARSRRVGGSVVITGATASMRRLVDLMGAGTLLGTAAV